ncbi:MAG: ABC transporter permease subunit [Eubacteriales bacterium]|nr:ABC transporter permease subunit [Eubacteriales bacterium]
MKKLKEQNKKKLGFKAAWLRDWRLWVMITPLLIWLALFAFKPLTGMSIAFLKYNPFKGISGSKFIGFENFTNLMFGPSSEYFWRAFKNTIILSGYGIIFGFPAPIILAILLHEVSKNSRKKIVQTVTYAPHFLSEVVVCGVLVTMLALNTGLFNVALDKLFGLFGVDFNQIQFMAESKYFRAIYTLSGIWKEAGFGSIVFFSALCGIPEELYEAAKVDGASRIKRILHISIPGITPTIVIMFIIKIGKILNLGYEKVLLLYNPSIYDKADILSTYIYRMGVQTNPNYGMSTAASLFNSLIGFALVILANRISKKFSETALW